MADRRITPFVQRAGIAVGQGVVRRILRSDNLPAIRKRKFKPTTNSEHGFTVYPNLAQYVKIKALNQLWVADITYLRWLIACPKTLKTTTAQFHRRA